MKVGISTACLYPQETEAALDQLLDAGFDCFEIFLNTISEMEPAYVRKLREKLVQGNAVLKSLHPFTSGYEPYLIFTDYKRRFRDSLDFYKRYFETAQYLGAGILVLHGDKKTPETGISNEEYFEKFGELSLLGERYGVTLAQENVNQFRSQNPSFLKQMRTYLGDRAKFVFDIKQAVRSGNDPTQVCRAMGKGLVHLHINDNKKGEDCLLPGCGAMDYSALFALLKENRYQGDCIIEVYSNNYSNIWELVQARNFVRRELTAAGL